jgi:hypothetical protein
VRPRPLPKTATIKLDEQYTAALKHFQRQDPRHMSMTRQVKLAVMCYWENQRSPEGIAAYEIANRDDWDPKGFIVNEDKDADEA